MPDPSTILTTLKAASAVARRFDQATLKAEYAELVGILMDAREQAFAMQEELHEAKRRVREMGDAAKVREGLTYDRSVYWRGESREHGTVGPFCPRCMDAEGLLMRLTPIYDAQAHCQQPGCKAAYVIWPERQRRSPGGGVDGEDVRD